VKVKTLVKKILAKTFNPKNTIQFIRIVREKKKSKSPYYDPGLKLGAQITPGKFLHHPYFKNPDLKGEEISMVDIKEAGDNYTNLLIDSVEDRKSPILDVGCGLGELSNLLKAKGLQPVALTPDGYQFEFIQKTFPDLEVINSKFEDIEYNKYSNFFGTIIMSESCQYIKMEKAFPLIDSILKPGGSWIIADFFKIKKNTSLRGGHDLKQFVKDIAKNGWTITFQQDITANILPFLDYCGMLSNRFIVPLVEHIIDTLHINKPGVFFLLEDAIDIAKGELLNFKKYVDPELFAQERKYMFLVMKKKD
jgi:SAM-dependent methyltransferase